MRDIFASIRARVFDNPRSTLLGLLLATVLLLLWLGADAIQAVTAEDIQRVAKTYFDVNNRSVATFKRKAGAAACDKNNGAFKFEPNRSSHCVSVISPIGVG